MSEYLAWINNDLSFEKHGEITLIRTFISSQLIFSHEMSAVWKASIAKAINIGVFHSASVLITMVLFGVSWYTGAPLSAQRIYSTLGWVFCLRLTVFLFMMYLVEDNKQLGSSLKRIQVHHPEVIT